MLDDVDDTLVPLRSKARAAIFKTTAHVSVARRDQEVHYRVLTDGYAGAAHGGCCPICQTLYQRAPKGSISVSRTSAGHRWTSPSPKGAPFT